MMSLITFKDEQYRQPYAVLVNNIKQCNKCSLCDKDGQRDIGEGFLPASIMVVAEMFGRTERKEGRPLCGEAGKLWREVMAKNNLSTSDPNKLTTYLTNTQCCWFPPPENIDSFYSELENGKPTPVSIEACKRFLWTKMKFVMPQVLISLGDIATRTVLSVPFDDTKFRISEALKQDHERNWPILGPVRIVPMFHPSYVLRQGRPANLMSLYDLLLNKVKDLLNVL